MASVVAALLVGGAAGRLAGRVTAGTNAPNTPPRLPAEFPDADDRYLPAVSVEHMRTWISDDNDYECEKDADSPTGAKHWLICHAPFEHDAHASLSVEYDDDAKVRVVTAACAPGPTAYPDYCPDMYFFTAANVFTERPELARKARQWAKKNVRNDALTVIGGVQLKTDLGDLNLRLQPAG